MGLIGKQYSKIDDALGGHQDHLAYPLDGGGAAAELLGVLVLGDRVVADDRVPPGS